MFRAMFVRGARAAGAAARAATSRSGRLGSSVDEAAEVAAEAGLPYTPPRIVSRGVLDEFSDDPFDQLRLEIAKGIRRNSRSSMPASVPPAAGGRRRMRRALMYGGLGGLGVVGISSAVNGLEGKSSGGTGQLPSQNQRTQLPNTPMY